MRDESFGPIIGIMAVEDDDEAWELMADTEYGLTAGVYFQGPGPGRAPPVEGRHGHRLLELLRPRQPPAAVVGPGPLGHRDHALHLWHPGLRQAQGLAPPRILNIPRP